MWLAVSLWHLAAQKSCRNFFRVGLSLESEHSTYLIGLLRFERGHCGLRISNIGSSTLECVKGACGWQFLCETLRRRNRVVTLFLVGFTPESEHATFLIGFLRLERGHCEVRFSSVGSHRLDRVNIFVAVGDIRRECGDYFQYC